jgi:anthranilate synthase component 1
MHFQTRKLNGELNLEKLYQFNPERYPFLLKSTAAGPLGNFDILFAFPEKSLEHYQENSDHNFLDELHAWWQQEKLETNIDNQGWPFTGGWFVYLSYELAGEIEPVLDLPSLPQGEPIAIAARCPAAVIYDHDKQQFTAVAETESRELLDQLESDAIEANKITDIADTEIRIQQLQEADQQPYLQQVETVKQYIVDGDIFQANLSRPWQLDIDDSVSDVTIFNRLASANPGSFAVLAKLPNSTVISSSPERLVSVHHKTIQTRPIAGTRPRSDNASEDSALASELMAHPKEQAEHIMLIDLERNDLGRICIPGSIRVNELMTLESYQHVHHIVSNVTGQIREDVSPADVIRAVFPGGTITGCPKVRCMQILAELEQQPRGAYTGSIGYINRNGDMDLNILIRTLVRRGNEVSFRAGGGIVADSDPVHELNETRAKAKGLLRAFGIN